MNLENLRMLEQAVEHLDALLDEVVFVGGATVELWITDEAAPEFRPTADVDVVVEITTRRDYYRFEKRLRAADFENDAESGVLCRFKHRGSGLVLDVMPTEASILGFENRWQADAFAHAVAKALPSGREIRAIPPPFLSATKLEAFSTRGKLDFFGSRDFGDVVALIDGREELTEEIATAPEAARTYVSQRLDELSRHRDFDRGLEGALPSSPEARERVDLVIWPRLKDIIALSTES
ncbi:MAG TPA: nucleotidyl transferase AbiEii/AbiGii toxin family protein [Solirubrobacterales bacterium]|nr:nucleotidyl transferase AbiEii/AbiGii toxin family protein [Solirubrobacterales bacterium]